MIVVYIFVMILLIIATGIGYLYLDECSRLRKRLLKMGVNRDDISSFPKRISAFYLKDILYEKETELAEECFLTVEKDT